MGEKGLYTLEIDMEFKTLIHPLRKQEFLQLEENILSDGCRDPIITWKGVIIDGHNRYEICSKRKIPFAVIEKDFECREEVIAWICANQLGRRNLTEETRKYLIGMQYENEKIANSKKNSNGVNQFNMPGSHRKNTGPYTSGNKGELSKMKTAERIAQQNHVSHGTVEKYAIYSKAIQEIGKKEPKIVPKILSGQCKISHSNVVELSHKSQNELKQIGNRMEETSQPFSQYKKTRTDILRKGRVTNENVERPFSIKDMPAYDPDAEITGLTLTIPSWCSSISRVKNQTDLSNISDEARNKLEKVLLELSDMIDAMLDAIMEA